MAYREITYGAVIVRILAAIIAGGLIGLERGAKNRPAGLRTYMLVCVGACLIMLTNQYIYQFTGAGDPMRMGAQVVSGIGFLGAGTIVVTRHNQIKGLTTAAGLWASAGVGLAFGIGFYEAAITTAIGIYAILAIMQHWELRVHQKVRLMDVYMELSNQVPLNKIVADLRLLNIRIEDIQFESDEAMEDNARSVVFTLKLRKKEDHFSILEKIKKIDGVIHLEEL